MTLRFYSPALSKDELDLTPNYPFITFDDDFFVRNPVWNLDYVEPSIQSGDETDNITFSMVTSKIHLKRRANTVSMGVISPGIAISCLSMLYILIPRDSGARISYLTTVLLTMVQFLRMITGFVPVARELPASQEVFFYLGIVIFVCILYSAIIMYLTIFLNKGVIDRHGIKKVKRNITKAGLKLKKLSPEEFEDELFSEFRNNDPARDDTQNRGKTIRRTVLVRVEEEEIEIELWFKKLVTPRCIMWIDFILYALLVLAIIIIIIVYTPRIRGGFG